MIEECIRYYIEDINNRKLIFSKMKFSWYLFMIYCVIYMVSTLIIFFNKLDTLKSIYFGITTAIFIIMFLDINNKCKKIVKNNYNIESESFLWGGNKFREYKKEKIVVFLKKNNAYKKESIKEIINICNNKSEYCKNKNYYNWGVFFAIFIPLWTQFISAIFRNIGSDITQIMSVFKDLVLIILMCFIALSMLIYAVKEFYHEIVNARSNKIKELIVYLEEIVFEIDIVNSNIIIL